MSEILHPNEPVLAFLGTATGQVIPTKEFDVEVRHALSISPAHFGALVVQAKRQASVA